MNGRATALVGLALLSVACGQTAPASPEARGRAVYASYNCQQCHRIGSVGGTTGPDLTFVGFRKDAEFLDLWLKDPAGWQPPTLMPNFRFNDRTRADLAAYLATLKGQAYGETRPWDAAGRHGDSARRGKAIYATAGCATCHGKAGAGGYRNNNVPGGRVPALTAAASGFSRAELIDKIRRGVPHPQKEDPKGPEPRLRMPAWGGVLREDELGDVADYVLSLGSKEKASDW